MGPSGSTWWPKDTTRSVLPGPASGPARGFCGLRIADSSNDDAGAISRVTLIGRLLSGRPPGHRKSTSPNTTASSVPYSLTRRPAYGGWPLSRRWMLDRVVNTWRFSNGRTIRRQPKPWPYRRRTSGKAGIVMLAGGPGFMVQPTAVVSAQRRRWSGNPGKASQNPLMGPFRGISDPC